MSYYCTLNGKGKRTKAHIYETTHILLTQLTVFCLTTYTQPQWKGGRVSLVAVIYFDEENETEIGETAQC